MCWWSGFQRRPRRRSTCKGEAFDLVALASSLPPFPSSPSTPPLTNAPQHLAAFLQVLQLTASPHNPPVTLPVLSQLSPPSPLTPLSTSPHSPPSSRSRCQDEPGKAEGTLGRVLPLPSLLSLSMSTRSPTSRLTSPRLARPGHFRHREARRRIRRPSRGVSASLCSRLALRLGSPSSRISSSVSCSSSTRWTFQRCAFLSSSILDAYRRSRHRLHVASDRVLALSPLLLLPPSPDPPNSLPSHSSRLRPPLPSPPLPPLVVRSASVDLARSRRTPTLRSVPSAPTSRIKEPSRRSSAQSTPTSPTSRSFRRSARCGTP